MSEQNVLEKKKIKYYLLGVYRGFTLSALLPDKIFSEFDFVLDKDNPDIVFYGSNTNVSDLNYYYDKVKIFCNGENLSVDFIFFDYCIGFDYLDFGDRFFRLPYTLWRLHVPSKSDEIVQKDLFCDFCYNHDRKSMLRKRAYDLLNKYKKVVVSGKYLSNDGIGKSYEYKCSIQKRCKFSLVIESTDCEGFITEKINYALLNGCIPIYFGTNKVCDYYNKKRIILAYDFQTLDDLLNYVIKVDSDDELYKSILSEPMYNPNFDVVKYMQKYYEFLKNIFINQKKYKETNYAPIDFLKRELLRTNINSLSFNQLVKLLIRKIINKFKRHKRKETKC